MVQSFSIRQRHAFMLRAGHLIASAAFYCVLLTACDNSTGPETPAVFMFQAEGCRAQSGLKWAASACFSYRFDDIFIVDFCAEGNCCPNSNRFKFASEIRTDTIFVTVADTAANECRCVCTYMLRAGFRDLELDSYVFICRREDESLLYSERLQRN